MSYIEKPEEDERLRKRIREILNEKTSNISYKGDGLRKSTEDDKMRQRIRKTMTKKISKIDNTNTNYCQKYCENCGYSIKNPEKNTTTKNNINYKRVRGGIKASKSNDWLVFYNKWLKKNKTKEFKGNRRQRIKIAGKEYRKWKSRKK